MHTTIDHLTDRAADLFAFTVFEASGLLDRARARARHWRHTHNRTARANGRFFQQLADGPRASLVDLQQPVAGELQHLDG